MHVNGTPEKLQDGCRQTESEIVINFVGNIRTSWHRLPPSNVFGYDQQCCHLITEAVIVIHNSEWTMAGPSITHKRSFDNNSNAKHSKDPDAMKHSTYRHARFFPSGPKMASPISENPIFYKNVFFSLTTFSAASWHFSSRMRSNEHLSILTVNNYEIAKYAACSVSASF